MYIYNPLICYTLFSLTAGQSKTFTKILKIFIILGFLTTILKTQVNTTLFVISKNLPFEVLLHVFPRSRRGGITRRTLIVTSRRFLPSFFLIDSGVHSSLGRSNGRTILPTIHWSSYWFRQLPWLVATISLSLSLCYKLQYNNPHSLSFHWFHFSGYHTDESAKDFLNRFPLPLIFKLLQSLFEISLIQSILTCDACIIYAFIVIRVLFNAVYWFSHVNLFCRALQTQFDVPGLETTLVVCLERLFKTKFGASLIPQYMVCHHLPTQPFLLFNNHNYDFFS